jgi:transcriptional regulator with XRE-family HTH domain
MHELKHAFFLDASILSGKLDTLRRMHYGDRLAEAINIAGASRKDVAKALGISVQAVGQAVRGETNAHTAENQARAARLLGVDYFWLATGEGKARPVPGWPFDLFDQSDYELVSEEYRKRIENELAGEIMRIKKNSNGKAA